MDKYFFEEDRDVADRMEPHLFVLNGEGRIHSYENSELSPLIGVELYPEDVGIGIEDYVERWHFSGRMKENYIRKYEEMLSGKRERFLRHMDSVPLKVSDELHLHVEAVRTGGYIVTVFRDESHVTAEKRILQDNIGIIMHEIMSPLSTIGGFANLIKRKAEGTEMEEYAGIIYENATQLEENVRDLLWMQKLEQERPIEKRVCNLYRDVIAPVLKKISGYFIERYDRPPMTIDHQRSLTESIEILTNPALMQVVYTNLFTNAAKYGETRMTYGANPEFSETHILLNVYNDGPPLEDEFIDSMFQRFRRGERAKRSGQKGLGLGLYNVKIIMNRLGGDIWVEKGRKEGVNVLFTHPKYVPEDL